MRISPSLPAAYTSQSFHPKPLSPSSHDSLRQACATDRQTRFPLAHWTQGDLHIFATFDLQEGVTAQVYHKEKPLKIATHLHLQRTITRKTLHQAQQTLSHTSLELHYEGKTLHLTPKLKLKGGMPQKETTNTTSLSAQDDDAHYHLALACIHAFEEGSMRPQDSAELAELARSHKVVRAVLAAFLKQLKEKTLLDPLLLRGLARALEYADPKNLTHTDLVAILDYLKERIAKLSSADEKRLTQELAALSSLLDAMVAADVRGLNRKKIHKAILHAMGELAKHRCEEIALLAQYCEQALARLPSDESKMHAFLRRALHASEGLSLLAHAWHDKSIGAAVGAFQEFYKAFKPEKGKKVWYESVQFAQLLIRQGYYVKAKEIVESIPEEYLYPIGIAVHALPKKERTLAKRSLPELPSCTLPVLPKAGVTLLHKARTTLPWRLHKLKEERLQLSDEEKLYIPLDGKRSLHAQERLDLLKETDAFLASEKEVLLIQGGSGAGKSIFLRMVERRCWKQEERTPLHIHLGKIDPNSPHVIEDALTSLHYKEEQIAELKTRRLVLFLDGYDEMARGQLVNLYEHGGIKGWNAKVVISCRSQHIANVDHWERFFAPFEGEAPNLKKLQTLYVAPFSMIQAHSYLEGYVQANPNSGWTTERFIETIEQIKGLKELIEAPFMLRITAEVLPIILEKGLPESLTRRNLYDAFSTLWFERQEAKLRASGREIPEEFQALCLSYCQDLAMAMVQAHVVEAAYNPLELFVEGFSPWEKFFGPNAALLRTAAPLTKSETGYAFIHRSLLEHFASKATAAQLAALSHPKKELIQQKSKKERVERPQAERYTTFEIESTGDLAKKWQGDLTEEEQITLYELAVDTIKAFSSHPPTEETMEEMIPLAAIPSSDLIRRLIEQLIHPLDQDVLIDLRLIRALSRAVALIDTKSVETDHLTTCIDVLEKRLSALHLNKSEEALLTHLYALEQLTAALLDSGIVVDEARVKDLLESLKKISSKNLQVIAARKSLKQALLRLDTDKDRLSDWLQRGKYIATGISALIESVGSYSPKKAAEGLLAFKEAVKTKGHRYQWYDELRTAQLVIEAGATLTYQEMQLKPKESHVQLALMMKLDRGVRRAKDETIRAAWVHEIISIGDLSPEIQRYVQSLVESYSIYDAPEVRHACSCAHFPASQAQWIDIHTPPSYTRNTLLAEGKKTLSWRLVQLKTAALNDPMVLQERAFYVPLDAAHYASSSNRFSLDRNVHNFLSSDKRVLLLLGESGSGKSLSMKLLTAELWKEEEGPIPLLISLTGVARTTITLIEKALKKEGFTDDQIAELKENRDFIFILDGYDEMSGKEMKNLLTTNNLLSWHGKVIFTCRTQYAQQASGNYAPLFMPYDSEGKPRTSLYEEITTVPFTSDQIERYLEQFCAQMDTSWTPDVYHTYIDRLPKVREMIETPFVLRILTEVLPDIIAEHGGDDLSALQLTRTDFYEAFVRNWFDRQLDKLIRGGWGTLSPSEAKGYYIYSVRLATQMLTAGLSEVRYHPSQSENPFAPFFAAEPPLLMRARTACPLTISREKGEIVYRFLHKSLLEFLGGRGSCDEAMLATEELEEAIAIVEKVDDESGRIDADAMLTLPPDPQIDQIVASPLNQRLFTQEIGTLRFWVDDAQQNPLFRDQLLATIELSKEHPEVEVAAANAITILVGAEYNFSNADLHGIRVRGALLDRGNFFHADLRDADLRGCSFREGFLADANCADAHLEKIEWGNMSIFTTFNRVETVAYSPDGTQVALGHYFDNSLNIFDINRATFFRFIALWRTIEAIAYSPDGKKVAAGCNDCSVNVLNIDPDSDWEKTSLVCTFCGHDAPVTSVAFSPDGTQLASGSLDKRVQVWDVLKESLLYTLTGHEGAVSSIAYSFNGEQIASGCWDKTILVWDTAKKTILFILKGHKERVSTVAYNPKRMQIASASTEETAVRIWDAVKGCLVCALNGHSKGINTLVYNPDGTRIASGSKDQTVLIWDIEKSTIFSMIKHTSMVTSLAYKPDGESIVSGTQEGKLQIWSGLEKPFLAPKSSEQPKWIDSVAQSGDVAHSPDGKQIARIEDQTIKVIDAIEESTLFTLKGHTNQVTTVTYSPDGIQLASGSEDQTVRVWDAIKGVALLVLSGHNDSILAIAYRSDGSQIVVKEKHNNIKIWSLSVDGKSGSLQWRSDRHLNVRAVNIENAKIEKKYGKQLGRIHFHSGTCKKHPSIGKSDQGASFANVTHEEKKQRECAVM